MHQNNDSSPYTKEDIGVFKLWRPFVRYFCVTDMSKLHFNMLNRYLYLKTLCVATKSMFLRW